MAKTHFTKFPVLPSLDRSPDDYPYPIHDWRDESLYISERTAKDWAWEFFRRNSKYQYDHYLFANKGHFPNFEITYPDKRTLEGQKTFTEEMHSFGQAHNELIYISNLNHKDLQQREVKSKDGVIVPIKDAIWEKYGIFPQSNTLLHDPKLDLPEHNFFHADHSIFIAEYLENKPLHKQFSVRCRSKEDIIFRLNADKPIEKQLAFVKKRLLEKRSRLGIPPPNKSPRKVSDDIYTANIRMLDALASYGLLTTSKITNEISIEIVNEIKPLHPKEKSSHLTRLNEWIDRTYPIVEHGYLYLLDK